MWTWKFELYIIFTTCQNVLLLMPPCPVTTEKCNMIWSVQLCGSRRRAQCGLWAVVCRPLSRRVSATTGPPVTPYGGFSGSILGRCLMGPGGSWTGEPRFSSPLPLGPVSTFTCLRYTLGSHLGLHLKEMLCGHRARARPGLASPLCLTNKENRF